MRAVCLICSSSGSTCGVGVALTSADAFLLANVNGDCTLGVLAKNMHQFRFLLEEMIKSVLDNNERFTNVAEARERRLIDVASGDVKDIVTGRPFEFPNDLAWAGDHGFVTDIYGNSIFRFTADGESELWHQGDPLVGPVGIAVDDDTVYVVDPKVQKVFTFDRTSKEVGELEGF